MVPSSVADEELITLKVLVIDFDTRQPIDKASVKVWYNQVLTAQGDTNDLGLFTVQVPAGRNYRIYAYADDPCTKGWDYLPALKEILPQSDGFNLTLELKLGGSVIIDHEIQFLDTTTSVKTYTYEVRNSPSGETLDIGGYKLVYGTTEEAHTSFFGFNASHLIVPAEIPFDIKVNSSAIINGMIVNRSFIIDEPSYFKLSKGDLIHIDVRKYSLQHNLGLMKELIKDVEVKMDEMEGVGFYLFLEKHRLTKVSGIVDNARFNLLHGAYVDSFKEFRRAYVEITDINNRIVQMFRSATMSVYVLICFLAFTSAGISFLMLEKLLYKVVASGGLTFLMHIVLHEIYPGAYYVPTKVFFGFSAITWSVTLFITLIFPNFMKGRGVGGITPLRNIIVPIFSLAKRNLTRRRLRFLLTLSSVTVLVMSFVALTSFSMGYGLIQRRISKQIIAVDGVQIMAPQDEKENGESTFTPLDITAIEWLQKQGEVDFVSPKAENLPSLMPVVKLGPGTIYGVIGIHPSEEAKITGLDEIIVEGRYLQDGEEDAILISQDLKKQLDIEVNELLRLGNKMVRVVGIFRDRGLTELKDLDGEPLTPLKLVNLSPPGEPPDIQSSPAEADEIIISDLDTALVLPGVFISRINAMLRDEESVNDFAERAALERNYNVKASSDEGLYIARLGAQFQGKGLSLAIPWSIVMLNMIITMLNSLYERRKEVHILSSVGLNPGHIVGIFIAEAAAIGLIGGGIGYLLGLSIYKVMTLVGVTLEVRQKVSALWSLGALGLAMIAVIMGAVLAIKGSVVITPSLMRRWRLGKRKEIGEPLETTLPIIIPRNEISDFMDYIQMRLKEYENDPIAQTEGIRVWRENTGEKSTRGIRFIYRTVHSPFASFSTNRIISDSKRGEEVYRVRMLSFGDDKWVHETGSKVRMIIMRWSNRK